MHWITSFRFVFLLFSRVCCRLLAANRSSYFAHSGKKSWKLPSYRASSQHWLRTDYGRLVPAMKLKVGKNNYSQRFIPVDLLFSCCSLRKQKQISRTLDANEHANKLREKSFVCVWLWHLIYCREKFFYFYCCGCNPLELLTNQPNG